MRLSIFGRTDLWLIVVVVVVVVLFAALTLIVAAFLSAVPMAVGVRVGDLLVAVQACAACLSAVACKEEL